MLSQIMKPSSDSQNLQFDYDSQINLPRGYFDQSLSYLQLSRNVVCQDHIYSTKTCCLVSFQTNNFVFKDDILIYLLKTKKIFIVDEYN